MSALANRVGWASITGRRLQNCGFTLILELLEFLARNGAGMPFNDESGMSVLAHAEDLHLRGLPRAAKRSR